MTALKEQLGKTLERLGKGLQSREFERFEDTPYGNAQRLWRVLAPERKIDPLKSAFLQFNYSYDGEGVRPQNEEQAIFSSLLKPYRSLFGEFDNFSVSLSLSHKADDISFMLTVFAPPMSQQITHANPYSVLKILELPEQKRYQGGHIPYNVLIFRESELYAGRLDQELVGIDAEKGGILKERMEWSDEPQGDALWRRRFASETLKFLTSIAETEKEDVANWNREAQVAFKEREQENPWLRRSLRDKRQAGAVFPDNSNLAMMRIFRSKHDSVLST